MSDWLLHLSAAQRQQLLKLYAAYRHLPAVAIFDRQFRPTGKRML